MEVMFFFFNDTATTEIYTLSLHDALPISRPSKPRSRWRGATTTPTAGRSASASSPSRALSTRSEEHTSELQSRQYLVCRLLLEKKTNPSSRLRTTPVNVRAHLPPTDHHLS